MDVVQEEPMSNATGGPVEAEGGAPADAKNVESSPAVSATAVEAKETVEGSEVTIVPPLTASLTPPPTSGGANKDVAPTGKHNKVAPAPVAPAWAEDTRSASAETKSRCPRSKEDWVALFDNPWMVFVMTIATIFALFGDDLRLAAVEKDADDAMYALSLVCMIMFGAEFACYCVCKPGYLWSFFFYLDLVALLSLMPDIPWMWDPIMGGLEQDDTEVDASESTRVARAGRASRAGGRAGRLVRIIRIVRLFRVVKLYKYFGKKKKGDLEVEEDEDDFSSELSGSAIGEKLSESTTRGAILGVLLMLFALPYMEVVVLDESIASDVNELHELYFGATATYASAEFQQEAVENFIGYDRDFPLLYLEVDGTVLYNDPTQISALREEAEIYEYSSTDSLVIAKVNKKSGSVLDAVFNMILTFCVMLVLGVGATLFSADAEKTVITPIKQMVEFVDKISKNPLAKISASDMYSDESGNETALLQATLMKLAGLLQVGFGEAGSAIIMNNLDGDTVDPMINGQKIFAIFGFCDIRHFDDVNMALEEQIMGFVNTIADIVHAACHRFEGYANKNTGPAFLLVWKFPEDIYAGENSHVAVDVDPALRKTMDGNGKNMTTPTKSFIHLNSGSDGSEGKAANSVDASNNILTDKDAKSTGDGELGVARSDWYLENMSRMSNQALIAFLEVIVEIASSHRLDTWKTNPKILAKLPDYEMSMGFGLHVGWAIEGAIGSLKKIDASYLSPNVNMSSRLEAATQIFGVPLLFSGPFYLLLSPAIRSMCRRVDRVTVKGSIVPMDIWTFDIHLDITEDEVANIETKAKRTISLSAASNVSRSTGRGSILANRGARGTRGKLKTHSESVTGRQSRTTSDAGPEMQVAVELTELQDKPTGSAEVQDVEVDIKKPAADAGAAPDKEVNILDPAYIQTCLETLQTGLPKNFVEYYNQGMDLYVEGKWVAARQSLNRCRELKPSDIPTQMLLEFMEANKVGEEAPEGWKGFHPLNRKR